MNIKHVKVVSLLLTLIMLVSVMPIQALADSFDFDETVDQYYNVISKKDYDIAPGIVESEVVLNNDDGSRRQVLHFMEADISNPYTKIISSYTEMNTNKYQVSNMMDQATWIEKNWGWNVVGAMNTCLSWYNTDYYLKEHPELINEPLGFMMVDGVIMNDEAVGFPTVLVIHYDEKDGEARPSDIPKVEMKTIKTVDDLNGWEEQVIPCSSGFVLKDGVIQSSETHSGNDAPRSVVGIKADGTVVIMMNDGRQSPYSAGMTMYEIAAAMKAAGCVHAVNCDGGGSSTFLSQRPGEDLAVNCSPSDGALRSTTQGIVFVSTAPATGEFVRANITTESEYYTPGSTVTFNALGTDLVGTATTIPDDATWQIKEVNMGTISNGEFVSNGTSGVVTAQMVYNGNVVGEKSIEIVVPESLAFGQSTMTVPFGKEVVISLTATIHDGIHEVTLKPSDIVFTTTNDALGTFDGFKFTSVSADEAPENLTSTLTATLVHNTNLVAMASLNLGKGTEVIEDFENGVDGWSVGCVNSGGTNFYIDDANATSGQVHDGSGALKFNINGLNFDNTAGSYKQVAIYPKEDIIVENAKSIGAWVYIPDEFYNLWIRFHYYYEGADGKYTAKNTVPVFNQPSVYNLVNESGWYYFSVDVSAYKSIMIKGGESEDAKASRFIEFNACHMATNDIWTQINGTLNGDYTLYVDSICADFSDAVDDREAPIFDSVNIVANDSETVLENHGMATITTNVLNVTAKVSEDTTKTNATGLNATSAKAYVDGALVDSTYSNGKIVISDLAVADGVHRIKFEICDNMGNKSVVVRLIKVHSGVDASTVQIVPADASLDKILGGSVYWMNVHANKIETIQSVKAAIDLNSSNHWELDHMEVAEGFTATHTIDAENNTATITIQRTGANKQTGAETLAALPIRVIYYDTDINLDGYTAEQYWKDYNFWSHDVKVDVDMGQITYVDGYTSSVLNTFSNEEFSVDTEWYTSGLNTDAAHKTEKGTSHVHTAEELIDSAATCTQGGYTGRTFCEVCNSVVDWGTKTPAKGHSWAVNEEGKLACKNGGELFNGVFTDGKTYVDGVAATDGWNADKTSYFKDGLKLTGSHMIDGVMCTFDENGTYLPNMVYEGFYETTDGKHMYFVNNKHITGLNRIVDDYCNFDKNGYAYDGVINICGYDCTFDKGVFIPDETVTLAGLCGENIVYVMLKDGRMIMEGEGPTYDFTNVGVIPWYDWAIRSSVTSIYVDKDITAVGTRMFYNLDHVKTIEFEEGSKLITIKAYAMGQMVNLKKLTLPETVKSLYGYSFYKTYYLEFLTVPETVSMIGDTAFDEVKNITLNVVNGSYAHTYAVNKGINYAFYAPVVPEMKQGLVVDEDGEIRYYIDGVAQYAGLVQDAEGNYYYIGNDKKARKDCYYGISKTNGLLPSGGYWFDVDGKLCLSNPNLKQGVVMDEDGEIRYYIDGVAQYAGLVQDAEGNYYYIGNDKKAKKDCYYGISKTNGLLPSGGYWFDVDGKMIVEE